MSQYNPFPTVSPLDVGASRCEIRSFKKFPSKKSCLSRDRCDFSLFTYIFSVGVIEVVRLTRELKIDY